jgi:hypothetical protein
MGRFWNCAELMLDNPSILTMSEAVNGDVGVKVKVRRADAREFAVEKAAKSGSLLKSKVQVVCSSSADLLITKFPLVIVFSKGASCSRSGVEMPIASAPSPEWRSHRPATRRFGLVLMW